MNKSNDFLESLTTSYFSNTTLKLCQDLLYIVYIYTGAPRRSWRQIVYLVDGVDLTSDPRHANPTRSLALDVLAPSPMSDECERLFSSCKILLEDRRLRLKMDIIEANEWLRHSYGPPRSNTFDDKGVGSV